MVSAARWADADVGRASYPAPVFFIILFLTPFLTMTVAGVVGETVSRKSRNSSSALFATSADVGQFS